MSLVSKTREHAPLKTGAKRFEENQSKYNGVVHRFQKDRSNQAQYLKNQTEQDPKKVEELINAIKKDDLTQVETFLKQGVDPNTADSYGNTLLHIASDSNDPKMLQLISSNGANPDLKNKVGDTVIHHAARKKNVEALKILAPLSKDLNVLNQVGRSALHIAISSKNKESVNVLLDNKADPNVLDKDLNAPIHSVIARGEGELLDILLKKGANPNVENNNGQTSLVVCIERANKEFVKKLVDNGADVNLIDKKTKKPPLMFALEKRNTEIAKMLVDKGADVNVELPFKNTLLIKSVERNDVSMIDLLLQSGAKVDKFNDFGDNALLVCAQKGNLNILDKLTRKGADINSQNIKTGRSALHEGTKNANIKMVEQLVLKGADINIKDKNGDSPIVETLPEIFHWWETPKPTQEHSKIARYFLDRNADIEPYETDNFFVSMLADTLNVDNPGYARHFLFSRVNNDWEKLDHRRVDALLNQYSKISSIKENETDKLLLKLLHPDINYKDDVQAARHSAHLRSWNGVVTRPGLENVDAEGWWMHVYPPLKIKSLILSLNKINKNEVDCQKEFMLSKSEAVNKIKNEIASQMSTYYSQRHHDMLRVVSDNKFKDDFKNHEISKYCKEIVKAPIGKEFAIASGFPGHAIYFGFRKMNEDNVARIVYNLGAGLNNHPIHPNGKVYPHVVSDVKMDHFVNETKEAKSYIKGVIDAKIGLHRDPYKPIYKDAEVLGGKYLTQNIPGIPQKRQLVGNCVLKNNNAAVRNRMGSDLLFKYLKKEETSFADEFSKIEKELIEQKEREKDINSFKYVIAHYSQSKNTEKTIENTVRFLEKKNSGDSEVANKLREAERIAYYLQNLKPELKNVLLKQGGAYRMLNDIAESSQCESLKIAIEQYNPQKKEVVKQRSRLSMSM